jgi:serine/threonine protein kinase/WD40 repeat protein
MALASGTRLGPYEVVAPLGSGGMGEVYRARDPRLGREVAIKLITTEGEPSPDRLRRFETEARAAAQLSHPNVVTVFDVGTHDGQPYLVLELLEGETLRETLRSGVPALRQAVTWALEVSRGLAAAHERGIVHRDLKPENVFLTSDGRVKVLDFGLAKLHETLVSDEVDRESPTATKGTSPGVLLGTIGYMSPEQVKGETPDARTDVFALGTVLYELVTGRKAFGEGTAPEVLASILRDEPPPLESVQHGVPASVETVVRRCLAKRPADRFSSGRAVEAALETVLVGLEASRVSLTRPVEPRGPYPGLSSFTEADAGRFFGREAEVESLWAKLRQRKLLALIGPSGAGKTSFVRAGLVASRPSGWGTIVATPGSAPMRSLAQALVEVLPSDTDTVKQLLAFDDPDVAFSTVRKWRESHPEAVLVVDQFEELFTLNPPETHERFAELLGRFAGDGDVHVLLSMRDDFLIRCHEQQPLESVFQNLTPILSLGGEGLRRALTEPAKREGFAFEDEALVLEMLESVQEARGALPLLAFAVARLWEKRDRERKLLTRKAYEEIGGVAGALAQHAEQTLERIGLEREPIVRALFRNLVTAQWTRAVADREELLSVLPERAAGVQVLDQLIDARLLTSYEATEHEWGVADGSPSSRGAQTGPSDEGSAASLRTVHRIEIVHESLLKAWPRLVRWQAQDEEGAVLRDQLRQAARLWEEKNRPDDLLWTGTSEREFELWRDRYPGKLTALENDFARAMTAHAQRRRRRRRAAIATVVASLATGLVVVATLWGRAVAEAHQREAAELLALGRLELEDHPTAGLAYALASLERADNPAARRYAVEALAHGAAAFELHLETESVDFGGDGRWLATGGLGAGAQVWSREGGAPVSLGSPEGVPYVNFDPESSLLSVQDDKTVRIFSAPDSRPIHQFEPKSFVIPRASRLFTFWRRGPVHVRPVGEGEPRLLGHLDELNDWQFSSSGERLAYARDRQVFILPVEDLDASPRLVGEHSAAVGHVAFAPGDGHLVSSDESGEIRIWSLEGENVTLERTLDSGLRGSIWAAVDRTCSTLVAARRGQLEPPEVALVWDLNGPPGAAPTTLRNDRPVVLPGLKLDPGGHWLATAHSSEGAILWSLGGRRARIIRGRTPPLIQVEFTPDGKWLASYSGQGVLRLWPLSPAAGSGPRTLLQHGPNFFLLMMPHMGIGPDGRDILVTSCGPCRATLVPLDGGEPRDLQRYSSAVLESPAFSRDGRYAAAGSRFRPEGNLIELWDLRSGEVRTLDPRPNESEKDCATDPSMKSAVFDTEFTSDGRLLTAGLSGLRLWDVDKGTNTLLRPCAGEGVFPLLGGSLQDRFLLVEFDPAQKASHLSFHDVRTGVSRELTSHGSAVRSVALDPTGEIAVTGDFDGVVRVGPVTDEAPHLLYGHDLEATSVAVSPDGRWIASLSQDGTIRLWPMPEGQPFHTRPYEEVLARLRSYTNLRVVRDDAIETGYRVEAGPFPGWAVLPEW